MGRSSEQNPIEDISKGVTKGFLEWSEEKVEKYLKKFIHKKIYFTEDLETIELLKELHKQGEWQFFSNLIKDKSKRILFRMGLSLRVLEKTKKDFKPLSKKIVKKYDARGLHVAQFVQNGLFSKYVGVMLGKSITIEKLKSEIEDLFDDIDNKVAFIRADDAPVKKISEIVTKIHAHSPETFIISSVGEAILNCENVKTEVMKEISPDYICELHETEGSKKIYFLNRVSEV